MFLSAPPSLVPKAKWGASLHVYMGVTLFGLTEMIIVSGGSVKNRTYRRVNDGQLYVGVCAEEYQTMVLPLFAREGRRLFARRHSRAWMLQQDGAAIHQTVASLQLARSVAPGGLLEPWPANSPDFSLIENVWAMMAERISRMPDCTSIDDLKSHLEVARASIKAEDLRGLFASVPRRLKDCIEMGGATVRF